MNFPKAIDLYEKAASLGNCFAMKNLASIYEKGLKGVAIDFEKSAFHYFKLYKTNNENTALESFLNIISFEKVTWQPEYHHHWKSKSPQKLNQQIITLLLISRSKNNSKKKFVSSMFIKGISMKVIRFLCHANQEIAKNLKTNKK